MLGQPRLDLVPKFFQSGILQLLNLFERDAGLLNGPAVIKMLKSHRMAKLHEEPQISWRQKRLSRVQCRLENRKCFVPATELQEPTPYGRLQIDPRFIIVSEKPFGHLPILDNTSPVLQACAGQDYIEKGVLRYNGIRPETCL